MEEEAAEEAVAVRNDAMTIFQGHTGKEVLKYKYVCISLFYHFFHPPFSFFHLPLLFFSFFPRLLPSTSSIPIPPASVFSVSLHPSNGLVCSGGEDDRAFLWRPSDASVLLECNG